MADLAVSRGSAERAVRKAENFKGQDIIGESTKDTANSKGSGENERKQYIRKLDWTVQLRIQTLF